MSTHKEHVSPPEWAPPAPRRTSSPDTHEPDRETAVQETRKRDNQVANLFMLDILIVALSYLFSGGRNSRINETGKLPFGPAETGH